MAIVTGSDIEYQTARNFRTRCFKGRRSVLDPGTELWTPSNLAAASERLLAKDDKVTANYMERMRAQLTEPPAPLPLYQLIAESMAFYYLFPASTIMHTVTKINRVASVLSWAGIRGFEQGLNSCFGSGIGNVGTHYLSAQPYLMNFFLQFALEGQNNSVDFDDRLQCEALADDIRSRTKHVIEARHVLLHLLYPEHYESIASDTHKKKIFERYATLAPPDVNVDSALYSIRSSLTQKLGHDVHYYDADFRKDWDIKETSNNRKDADPIPSSPQLLLPYLQLVSDGEQHKGSDLLDPLASSFSLSSADRDRRLENGSERVFDNRVRWAMVLLRRRGSSKSRLMVSSRLPSVARSCSSKNLLSLLEHRFGAIRSLSSSSVERRTSLICRAQGTFGSRKL